ncbi:beta-defensin 123-like [Cricetulus griseus]|uniref:Beta-defensin n=2 Tax=Cricetulus griseus TaxID=10029 RepID=A0A9J7G7Q1_CRIGR|nr:beta-defensin 123-like [Cricetulus griseus]XP_027278514.1 beta-defensin 123-like [Cricetulus griseus]
MKTAVLAMALWLLLLSQVVPGNTERCWKNQGACRSKCNKEEKLYILCSYSKLCCVKPKKVPLLSENRNWHSKTQGDRNEGGPTQNLTSAVP